MNYDYGDNMGKIISVRISSDMFNDVSAISQHLGISNSKFIRLLIESYVEAVKKKEGV